MPALSLCPNLCSSPFHLCKPQEAAAGAGAGARASVRPPGLQQVAPAAMPGQLLPLRLLGSSSGLLGSARGMAILSRAFPFKLKYAGLCAGQAPRLHNSGAGAGVRPFSGRPAGSRGGGPRDVRRGDLRARSAAAGQGRGLVEDEAELSDWISDLKMDADSFRFGPVSESDDAGGYGGGMAKGRERGGGRSGDRGRVRDGRSSFRVGIGSESEHAGEYARDRAGGRERVRGRDGDGARIRDQRGRGRGRGRGMPPTRRGYGMSEIRKRDGESEGFDSFIERRQTRGLDRPSRGTRGWQSRRMASESDLDKEEKRFGGRRGERGSRGSQSRIMAFESDQDEAEEDKDFRGRKREHGSRGSQSRGTAFESDLDEAEEDKDFGPRKRERSRIGGMSSSSSLTKRGRKNSESGRLRGGGGGMLFGISDEEESVDDDETVFEIEDGFSSKTEDREEIVVSDAHDRVSLSQEQEDAPPRPSISEGADSYLSQTRFDQCSLSPLSLKGIKAAGYERMTVVQEASLPVILEGKDALAKAKTGTGKTVAFLLPAIEVITKLPPVDRDQKRSPINVLVVCPTRELANQAAVEADRLLKFHPAIGVQVVIGGTRLALEQKSMQANPCQILVATPGRLRDHIENTPGFATRLKGVKVLVLDEADHLLDMGFRKDIENIIAAVPKQRQTLLFSATVPDEVRQICHIALKRDHEFINTVEEGSEETHTQVKQFLLSAPLEKHFSMLYGILADHISENVDYKVLVFCTTAMVTKLVSALLSELNLNVREIHSRKPQSYRTRVSDEFRKSKGLILVTSDVSARGVDYPDVTLVVQVGVPADREQYIHRLGRTGRKGKEGKGILLLTPWEEFFLGSIKDLPISKAPMPLIDPDTRKKVEQALSHVEMKNKESAYQSWLGYYNSNKNIGRDKGRLVALANEFSRSMGLDNPPAIPKLVLGKMGLRNVPGLRAK